ncbi:AAA family ATPase [Microcella sp.]|uniref:AAA family ATPase n=1 Tax=Microcella sp. TaxID=1913979 RepID=UPI002565ADE6|nr:ATP-binding protein [Microcella sp.]MBX9471069.1 ATP-binding protein [Microcella sp.]
MENFDVLQALARTALAGNAEAISHQVERLADRLAEAGEEGDAKKLRALVTRSKSRQAVEPMNLQPSGVTFAPSAGQRLTAKATLPVDRESGAPLCEIVMPERGEMLPVLPSQAQAAYDSLIGEWQHEVELTQLGLPVSQSLLVYGPPGTGKTTLALAIASRLGRPAVVARLDGLISSLLGNTARNLGALFDFCNRYDSVLILDEFDAVAKIRDDVNEVGEIKRVVNALLQNLDKRTQFGLTIAVTNHERLLDSAVWRRFEHQIELGLPSYDGRFEIAHLSLSGLEDADTVARAIAQLTQGRSGADVRTLTLAFLKMSVLQHQSSSSHLGTLQNAIQATGMRGVRGADDTVQALVEVLREPPASLGQTELAALAGKDRKTIGRWLNEAKV